MTTPYQVILPQISVEAGFTAGTPVAGAGTFILDDATNGKLDTGTLGGTDAWTDITSYILGFTITRPSSRLVGPILQFQTGTASIGLDNSSGNLDPDNGAGPYAGQIRAMIPVRIRANWGASPWGLFRGTADSWSETAVSYSAGYSEWTLGCSDGFKVLSGVVLPTTGSVGGGEDTGARVNRVLTSAGWYTGTGDGARRIDTGDSTLQATTYGDTALNLMQIASDSELGELYIDGTGAVVFRHRQALLLDARSNTSQATFGDNPSGTTELALAAVGRNDDDTTIANDIQATRINGGALQEVQDAASEATYLFPRTYTRSDLILQDDPATLNWAQAVLYVSKTGEDRFDTVTIDPAADPANLWPQVLGRDIGDRITVIRRPSGVASPVTKDCFIAGITHTFDAIQSTWATTWNLADASKYGSFLVLDNTTLGKLDSNALAFLWIPVRPLPCRAADRAALDAIRLPSVLAALPMPAIERVGMSLRTGVTSGVPDRKRPAHVCAVRDGFAVVRIAAPAVLANNVVKCHAIGDWADLFRVEQTVDQHDRPVKPHFGASVCVGALPAPTRP